MAQLWLFLAVACNIAGYLFYWFGLRRQLVKPNRASWLIWAVSTTIEALTYQAVNQGTLQNAVFVVSSLCCLAVTVAVWRQSSWQKPTPIESFCMGLALAAMVIWFGFQNAFWAHMLVVVAVPISFVPTWISVWQDPRHERSPSWGLWTVGDFATLMVILTGATVTATMTGAAAGIDWSELPYIGVELASHASIWVMIGLATINPLRSFGYRRGRFFVLDVDKHTSNVFAIGENHLGQAVFAARYFPKGAAIVRFTGPRVHKSELPTSVRGSSDRFVQVDRDYYMGESGGVDDLVNHSCDPNAGLRFAETGITLVAIREIEEGEEITWDYSTTLSDSGWQMECRCNTDLCRGTVTDFELLDPIIQRYYRDIGVVPPYLAAPPALPAPEPVEEVVAIEPLRAVGGRRG